MARWQNAEQARLLSRAHQRIRELKAEWAKEGDMPKPFELGEVVTLANLHDVQVQIPGDWATVWFFTPLSEGAKDLFSQVEFEFWQEFNKGEYAFDHRPARAFADWLKEQGMDLVFVR